jgi:hypothetical protein
MERDGMTPHSDLKRLPHEAWISTWFIVALSSGRLSAAGTARSGPAVGEKVPGPFHCLNITGPDAGKQSCLYCRFGPRPVAMIFVRELNAETWNLIRRVNTAAAANDRLGAGVVFCSDE